MSKSPSPIHIINVPLDLGASRRGTDGGPSAFRIAGLSSELEAIGQTVADEIDVSVPMQGTNGAGNTKTRYKDEILAVCQELAGRIGESLEKGAIPLVIGGDHSIAMGTVSGVSAHLRPGNEKTGLIWFDAHGDMNTPDSSPTGNIHGMPLAHLLGYGDPDLSSIMDAHPAVAPENVALIGIRDIDSVERDFINSSGIHAFTMYDIDRLGMSEVARRALEIVNDGTAGFHVSFDLDGCDPEVMPGTGTTVPGGVSFREAHFLLEECASDGRMISIEMVELNPFLDHRNVSAERAVTLIQSAFGRSIL
jgi:arginase